MIKTSDNIKHAYFCKPRPNEPEIRTETFDQPRYDGGGITVIGYVTVSRCLECGAATYDTVPEDELAVRGAPTNYVPQPR